MNPITTSLSSPAVAITGAADGIGWATAQLFAARGWHVALLDMDDHKAKARAQALGPHHVGVTCDVTDEAQASAAIAHTVAQLGRLDALVNNAGIGDQTVPTLQQTAQAFDRVLSVHLRGAFLMTQAALVHMQTQDRDAKGKDTDKKSSQKAQGQASTALTNSRPHGNERAGHSQQQSTQQQHQMLTEDQPP